MRRHITRRGKKRQRKLIIFSIIGIFCLFSAGYAAFSSNFLVSGKGTIVEKKAAQFLKESKVTSGDGLYEDIYEENKYIYRGGNPNNFISFNDELWRIISIEADNTLKIIRNENNNIDQMSWDVKGTRNANTSTYCTNASDLGCNAWASTITLANKPNVFTLYYPNGNSTTDTAITGSVTQDASLNTYLNDEYLGTIEEDSKYIVDHDFSVGTPGNINDTETVTVNVTQEALYKWNGKGGLMNITDILRTTTNAGCTSLNVSYNSGSKSVCSNNNWMWPTTNEWTLSPDITANRNGVWVVQSLGYVYIYYAKDSTSVRPVLYLSSDVTLSGEGTSKVPYTIN